MHRRPGSGVRKKLARWHRIVHTDLDTMMNNAKCQTGRRCPRLCMLCALDYQFYPTGGWHPVCTIQELYEAEKDTVPFYPHIEGFNDDMFTKYYESEKGFNHAEWFKLHPYKEDSDE